MAFTQTLQHKSKVAFLYSLPDSKPFAGKYGKVDAMARKLSEGGVECVSDINSRLLGDIAGYEVVIVLAHLDADKLVLAAGAVMTVDEFVDKLPADFSGIIDLSSCHSARFARRVKERCPGCHVLAALESVTLDFRVAIYPVVLRRYLDKSNTSSYQAIFAETMAEGAEMLAHRNRTKKRRLPKLSDMLGAVFSPVLDLFSGVSAGFICDDEYVDEADYTEPVKLGNEASSIFAPSAVAPGDPFLVQLFIHSPEEGDMVLLSAQRCDPYTGMIETAELPVKLKRGDRLAARLSFQSPERALISIDGDTDTKTILWTGRQAKIQFCAMADASFSKASFMARLQLEVNSQPVGDCYFKIKVDRRSDIPADIRVESYSKSAESVEAAKSLKDILSSQEQKLTDAIGRCNDADRNKLQSELEVCRQCLRLVDTIQLPSHNSPKKVFISSTSDLESYRDVLRAEIMRCEMYPEMYENWAQTGFTPRDECFRRVLASDAVVLLLGIRYGFVENSLGMSMTELEYRAALLANKPLLVFVMRPPKASDEPEDLIERQNRLIEEVCTARILKFFSNTDSLARIAASDISRVLS